MNKSEDQSGNWETSEGAGAFVRWPKILQGDNTEAHFLSYHGELDTRLALTVALM